MTRTITATVLPATTDRFVSIEAMVDGGLRTFVLTAWPETVRQLQPGEIEQPRLQPGQTIEVELGDDGRATWPRRRA